MSRTTLSPASRGEGETDDDFCSQPASDLSLEIMRLRIAAATMVLCALFAPVLSAQWIMPCAEMTPEQRAKIYLREFDARPGETIKPSLLILGVMRGLPNFIPATAACSAKWSVQPRSGATLNAATGELRIASDVPYEHVYTLTAIVEGVAKPLTTKVRIFTNEGNPLVGRWREKGGQEISVLRFYADGRFEVVYRPLETRVDYWGTYTQDPERGTLDLKVSRGNTIPPDMIRKGTFKVDEGVLTLEGIYLGTFRGKAQPKKHVFVK